MRMCLPSTLTVCPQQIAVSIEKLRVNRIALVVIGKIPSPLFSRVTP